MQELLLDKLPKTPLYESFGKYLNTLKNEDGEAILKYLLSSPIIGNPVLEELFMREQSAVFQLMVHDQAYGVFREDIDNWIAGLEPRFQGAAQEFFDGITDFVGDAAKVLNQTGQKISTDLVQAQATLVTETSKVIAAGAVQLKAALDAHAGELEARLSATAESERKKVVKALVDSLNAKLDPHVEKAFNSSTDKFRLKTIARDIGVVLIAFCIYSGMKAVFF